MINGLKEWATAMQQDLTFTQKKYIFSPGSNRGIEPRRGLLPMHVLYFIETKCDDYKSRRLIHTLKIWCGKVFS